MISEFFKRIPPKKDIIQLSDGKKAYGAVDRCFLFMKLITVVSVVSIFLKGSNSFGMAWCMLGGFLSWMPDIHKWWFVLGQPTLSELKEKHALEVMLTRWRIAQTLRRHLVGEVLRSKRYVSHNMLNSENGKLVKLPLIMVDGKQRNYRIRISNQLMSEFIDSDRFLKDFAGELPKKLMPYIINLGKGGNFYEIKLIDLEIDSRFMLNNKNDIVGNASAVELSKEILWSPIRQPHMIVSGATGSGKSMLLSYIALSGYMKSWEVCVIDPKHSDLGQLSGVTVAMEISDILNLLRDKVNLMQRRESDIRQGKLVHFTLLIIDEVSALQAAMNNEQKKEYQSLIKQLVLMGRSSLTFIVLATQQANAQSVPTDIREQMSVRVLLGKTDSSERQFLFNEVPNAVEAFPYGVGQGLISSDKEVQYFETPVFTVEPERLFE